MKKEGIQTRKRKQKGGAMDKLKAAPKRGRGTGKYIDKTNM